MSGTGGDPSSAVDAESESLAAWTQGDYTLSVSEFLVANGWNGTELETDAEPVEGLVVVSQTCDIVNTTPGKQHVVVCPLIKLTEKSFEDICKARSPAATTLEHPPEPCVVVDLGRMMSVNKSVLVRFERKEGFTTDEARTAFADALRRKHGRFAFPDKFNDRVLAKLRDRICAAHGKRASDHGKAYRSIHTTRVTAFPGWDAPEATVFFHFVLEPEAKREVTRAEIAKTLDDHLGRITWPEGFRLGDPAYLLVTPEEMTAAEWIASQPVDWDFVSSAGAAFRPK
jgi:hypothetical protein